MRHNFKEFVLYDINRKVYRLNNDITASMKQALIDKDIGLIKPCNEMSISYF